MPIVYSFEAKSIQSHILDSNKLKDMVGASEQIENLCTESGLLDAVLAALNLSPEFSRRAGGTFTAFFEAEDDAKKFQAVWTYCVQQGVPGLSFVQGMHGYDETGEIKSAVESVSKLKEQDRNRLFPALPLPGPLVARYPRTGRAASKRKDSENLDEITLCKREFKGRALLDKVNGFTTEAKKPDWPTYFPGQDNLDDPTTPQDKAFPLLRENPYIGIVHADGNAVGALVRQLSNSLAPNDYRQSLLEFSNALESAVRRAVYDAIKYALVKHAEQGFQVMPARPLVVGGDDISFIVRGDLALPFTERFLEQFEHETAIGLLNMHTRFPEAVPETLTACAGIAFVKAGQPFHLAYRLAESLCNHAKRKSREQSQTRPIPSSLAFHRITTSIIDSYETIRERELEITREDETLITTMQPYFVGDSSRDVGPRLSDLVGLADELRKKNVSQSAVRELVDLVVSSPQMAAGRHQRWKDNMEKAGQENVLQLVTGFLEAMTGTDHPHLPGLLKREVEKKVRVSYCPLMDALALNSVRRGNNDGQV